MLRSALRRFCFRPLRAYLPQLRNRHFLLLDLLALCFTPMMALTMRLDGVRDLRSYLPALLAYTAFALIVRIAIFYPFGLYGRYWRYATVDEMLQTAFAVAASTAVLFVAAMAGAFQIGPENLPRSVALIDGLLVLFIVGGMRFSVRVAYRPPASITTNVEAERVIVVGAGIVGQMIVRELRANLNMGLRAVGFIDDDPEKQHLHIAGLPVFGTRSSLPSVVREHNASLVIIATPNAPGKTVREFLSLCEQAGVAAKTVPGVSAIIGGKVRVSTLRNVDIEDLLRRDPIRTDIAAVSRMLRGKRVMVTGGGGSIGSELCRQVLRCGPTELIILGHGENSVFEINNELRRILAHERCAHTASVNVQTRLTPVIADVRDAQRLGSVVGSIRPEVVFHAAAHKHVPLMEANPSEAVTNNILGTRNLLQACQSAGVEHFVMISTDKAVNPTSVMGCSKRVAEMLVLQAARETGRQYVAVRFGNVLGSRGSVVPIFRRQIAEGGPVTVSHPDMTRYFMTIPEAVQLVLQASVLGHGGEVFMLDMGEPVKIVDLAHDLIELSGLEVGRDIDIQFTGTRPGEKLFEELLLSSESYQPTEHAKVRFAKDASASITADLPAYLDRLRAAATRGNRAEIVGLLRELVPEFQPDEVRMGEGTATEGQVSPVPVVTAVRHDALADDAAGRPAVPARP